MNGFHGIARRMLAMSVGPQYQGQDSRNGNQHAKNFSYRRPFTKKDHREQNRQ